MDHQNQIRSKPNTKLDKEIQEFKFFTRNNNSKEEKLERALKEFFSR